MPARYRAATLPSRDREEAGSYLKQLTMLGILVHGDNHFIVSGPLPDREIAIALVRHWSLIQIGVATPPPLDRWRIISKAFRENLEWAVVVTGAGETSPAVQQLLGELSARGIAIHNVANREG